MNTQDARRVGRRAVTKLPILVGAAVLSGGIFLTAQGLSDDGALPAKTSPITVDRTVQHPRASPLSQACRDDDGSFDDNGNDACRRLITVMPTPSVLAGEDRRGRDDEPGEDRRGREHEPGDDHGHDGRAAGDDTPGTEDHHGGHGNDDSGRGIDDSNNGGSHDSSRGGSHDSGRGSDDSNHGGSDDSGRGSDDSNHGGSDESSHGGDQSGHDGSGHH